MLNKLMKYEIKATARIFLPLYGTLLVFAALNKLFLIVGPESTYMRIMSAVIMVSYVLSIVAVFAITFFIALQRFYKNLLGDEGYLMFTLPVKPWAHIVSKLLVTMMWVFCSVFCALLSVAVIAAGEGFWTSLIDGIRMALTELREVFGVSGFALIFEAILMILISLSTSILMFYTAIAIGQMVSRHKLLTSIGAYLGLSMFTQIVVTTVAVTFGLVAEAGDLTAFFTASTVPHYLLIGISLFNLVVAGAYFTVTNLILTRRLNLE